MSGPRPPPDLHRRSPDLLDVATGSTLHRFYTAAFDPIHFDRSGAGRFNAVDASHGVLYCAMSVAGGFAETFLRTPGRTLIDPAFLRRKAYVRLAVVAPLRFVRLYGPGMAKIGATAEVAHGGLPYILPQSWAKAIADHPIRPDGLVYHARHDDTELCCAIFDRASACVIEDSRIVDLDQDWFWRLAERYGIGMTP
ncbi:RES domain-containing protein [Roseiarcus fermentans]|uniref:RES domain-containing protein n=1 Tax=Roseiarcus fermentans TaxID=1473586 RepID=A0A366FLK6_9HYPH|nr:RES family NAD+ phosphorylase [Roseiarcus fermentans]RBP15542.1 RES domain-containing protein [Roseiarcus fermentans]